MNDRILAQECRKRLANKHEIVCVLGGTHTPSRQSDYVCVVVKEDGFGRARWRVADRIVDAVIASSNRFALEFERSTGYFLAALFTSARVLDGDKGVASSLQASAANGSQRPAPRPSPAEIFRFRCQPYDLLRMFRSCPPGDAAAASLVVGALVQAAIEGYFLLHRIRRPEIVETLSVISSARPDIGSALRRVLVSSVQALQAEPKILDELVTLVFGNEGGDVRTTSTGVPEPHGGHLLRNVPARKQTHSTTQTRKALQSYARQAAAADFAESP